MNERKQCLSKVAQPSPTMNTFIDHLCRLNLQLNEFMGKSYSIFPRVCQLIYSLIHSLKHWSPDAYDTFIHINICMGKMQIIHMFVWEAFWHFISSWSKQKTLIYIALPHNKIDFHIRNEILQQVKQSEMVRHLQLFSKLKGVNLNIGNVTHCDELYRIFSPTLSS